MTIITFLDSYQAIIIEVLGDFERAKIYQDKQVQLQEAMDDLFYNKTLGSWFDFSLRKKAQNTEQFYLSSAVPLFTKCYNDMDRTIPDRYVDYLKVCVWERDLLVFIDYLERILKF